jgi:hypothetical protein
VAERAAVVEGEEVVAARGDDVRPRRAGRPVAGKGGMTCRST